MYPEQPHTSTLRESQLALLSDEPKDHTDHIPNITVQRMNVFVSDKQTLRCVPGPFVVPVHIYLFILLDRGATAPVINVAGGPGMSDMRHIIGSLLTSPASIIYNGSLVQLLQSDTLQPTTPMTKHYRSYHRTNLSVSGEIQDILGHMEIGDCNWCLHLCVYTYWADCNSDFNVVY